MLVKKRAKRTTKTSKEDFLSDINTFSKWGWSLFIGNLHQMFNILIALSEICGRMIGVCNGFSGVHDRINLTIQNKAFSLFLK
jgi:hypothetical protein